MQNYFGGSGLCAASYGFDGVLSNYFVGIKIFPLLVFGWWIWLLVLVEFFRHSFMYLWIFVVKSGISFVFQLGSFRICVFVLGHCVLLASTVNRLTIIQSLCDLIGLLYSLALFTSFF